MKHSVSRKRPCGQQAATQDRPWKQVIIMPSGLSMMYSSRRTPLEGGTPNKPPVPMPVVRPPFMRHLRPGMAHLNRSAKDETRPGISSLVTLSAPPLWRWPLRSRWIPGVGTPVLFIRL